MKQKISINSCWATDKVGQPHIPATKADHSFRIQMFLPREIRKHSLEDEYITGPKVIVPDTKQSSLISCAPYSTLCCFELTWRAVFSSMSIVFVDTFESYPLYHIPSYCCLSLQSSPLQFTFENAARKNFLKRRRNS